MDAAILRDRLRGIVKPAGPTTRVGEAGKAGEAGLAGSPDAGSAIGAAAVVSGTSLEQVLGGSWRGTAGVRSFVITRRFAPHDRHGRHRIEQFAHDVRAASASAVLVGAAAAQLPFVFFDLETTGLNGGAGTHAFLVGCGWFDADDGFVTEQHLMTEYAGERQMLHAVAAELDRAGALVTFNGKSFDAPMLETRYLFHRLQSPCTARPHVDLLHPSRRFWGQEREAGCSLSVLERHVLGVHRAGDVAGCDIPSRYFQFVRSGDARPLLAVLDHNRLDLLSLAGLTARVFHLVKAGPGEAQHPREALALGRVYRAAGLDERAEEAFERAVSLTGPRNSVGSLVSALVAPRSVASMPRLEALRALATGARRQRRYEAAAARWRELLDMPGCPGPLAREAIRALAIHHEHRARDLAMAKVFAQKGLELEAEAASGDAARHRLARIERKIVSERRSLFPSSLSQLPLSCGSPTSERQTSS